MEFNVAQLEKGPVGTVREYEIDEVPEDIPDVDWAGPCRGKVKVVRTGRGALVRARLQCQIRTSCVRCLEDFIQTVDVRFEEEYLTTLNILTGLPVALAEEDEGSFVIDEKHTLDLREAIRQYALLAQPMQPICRPDCQGICPGCGAELNHEACRCVAEAVTQLSELSQVAKGA